MSFGGGRDQYILEYVVKVTNQGGVGGMSQLSTGIKQMDTSTRQATASAEQLKTAHERVTQAGLGVSKAAKGMAFGFIGMTTAGAEMVGMLSMYQQTQLAVKEAQEEQTKALKEGGKGSQEYKQATQELAKANRWASMTFRNLMLSIFDMIPFLVLSVNGILKLRTALAAAREAKAMEAALRATGTAANSMATASNVAAGATTGLGTATKASTTAIVQQRVASVGLAGPLGNIAKANAGVAASNLTVAATAKTATTAMRVMKASTIVLLPLLALEGVSQAIANNWGGFRDKIQELHDWLIKIAPVFQPVIDAIWKIGEALAAVFTGDFEKLGELFSGKKPGEGPIETMSKSEEKAAKEWEKTVQAVKDRHAELINSFAMMGKDETKGFLNSIGMGGKTKFDDAKKDIKKIQEGINEVTLAFQGFADQQQLMGQIETLEDFGFKIDPDIIRKQLFGLEDIFDEAKKLFPKGSLGRKLLGGLSDAMRADAKSPDPANAKAVTNYLVNHPEILSMAKKLGLPEDIINFLNVKMKTEAQKIAERNAANLKAAVAASQAHPARTDPGKHTSGVSSVFGIPLDKFEEKQKSEAEKKGETFGTQLLEGIKTGLKNAGTTLRIALIDPVFQALETFANSVFGIFATAWKNPEGAGAAAAVLLGNIADTLLDIKFWTATGQSMIFNMISVWKTITPDFGPVSHFLAAIADVILDVAFWTDVSNRAVGLFVAAWETIKVAFMKPGEFWAGFFDKLFAAGPLHDALVVPIQNFMAQIMASIEEGAKLIKGPVSFVADLFKQLFPLNEIRNWVIDNVLQPMEDIINTGIAAMNLLPGIEVDQIDITPEKVNVTLPEMAKWNAEHLAGAQAVMDKLTGKTKGVSIPSVTVNPKKVQLGKLPDEPPAWPPGINPLNPDQPGGQFIQIPIASITAVPDQVIIDSSTSVVNTQEIIGLFQILAMAWDQVVVAKIADGAAAANESVKQSFSDGLSAVGNGMQILAEGWSAICNSMGSNAKSGAQQIYKALNQALQNVAGVMNQLAKHWSKVCNSMGANARSAASQIKSALNSIPKKIVTIHETKHINTFAEGGIVSAASGKMLTAHGKRLIQIGDNPGGQETLVAIPHNNPGPMLQKITDMFGGRTFSTSRQGRIGGGRETKIHIHNHLLERDVLNIINIDKGRMMSKYGA